MSRDARENTSANGNITHAWRGSSTFASATEKYSYVYDAANQLLRENLCYGNGNANNATVTYEYDQWGNILCKKTYAYTEAATITGVYLAVIDYSYSSTEWGDMLTSYSVLGNATAITYDSMGNPTSYLGKTLTWEGKQLVSYATAGSGISGRLNTVTYAYDQNGLRTQKNHNGTVTSYYYNGSVLMGMVKGTGTTAIHQLFSYDASGNVVSVDYSSNGGSSFTTYYYLRNAQNDVVKLIDGTGATVVQYTYDSWGKHIATTGTLASTVGQNQPFRYRGYIYDAETGWYYLQSRYYDPTTCRFISADVLLSTGQGVLGHNAFAYCLSNPVNMSDEGGCRPMPYNTMMTDGPGQVFTDAEIKAQLPPGALDGVYFSSVGSAARYAGEYIYSHYGTDSYEYSIGIIRTEIEYADGIVVTVYCLTQPATLNDYDISGSPQMPGSMSPYVSVLMVGIVHNHSTKTSYTENMNRFSCPYVTDAYMTQNDTGVAWYFGSCYLIAPDGGLYALFKCQVSAYAGMYIADNVNMEPYRIGILGG